MVLSVTDGYVKEGGLRAQAFAQTQDWRVGTAHPERSITDPWAGIPSTG